MTSPSKLAATSSQQTNNKISHLLLLQENLKNQKEPSTLLPNESNKSSNSQAEIQSETKDDTLENVLNSEVEKTFSRTDENSFLVNNDIQPKMENSGNTFFLTV